MKRKRIPGAHGHKTTLVEFTVEALPVTPEMKSEPRLGRPPRHTNGSNGANPVPAKRKKKSD